MYEVFYKLTAEPFRLSPDHHFCYEHKCYVKARAYMAYAFMRAEGFVMITGRPGTGKTTLIGELIESLAADNVATANLVAGFGQVWGQRHNPRQMLCHFDPTANLVDQFPALCGSHQDKREEQKKQGFHDW